MDPKEVHMIGNSNINIGDSGGRQEMTLMKSPSKSLTTKLEVENKFVCRGNMVTISLMDINLNKSIELNKVL